MFTKLAFSNVFEHEEVFGICLGSAIWMATFMVLDAYANIYSFSFFYEYIYIYMII